MKLCNAIPKQVYDSGECNTKLHRESIELANKFKQVFDKYAKCHELFNSSKSFKEEEITVLGMNNAPVEK